MVAERDVRRGRHVAHLHSVVATLRAQLEGRVDDPLATVALLVGQVVDVGGRRRRAVIGGQ